MSLLVCAAALVACTADEGADEPELADLAGLTDKSDGFQAVVKLEPPLDYGESSGNIAYTSSPRYRGFKFQATAGDKVEVVVHAPSHVTPLAWILDDKFEIVSQGQEVKIGATGGRDAHVRFAITGGTDQTYYVMVRTANLVSATLQVDLVGTLPAPGCDEDNPVTREIQPQDRAMPRAVLSYMRAKGWGCMHREWHDVRQLDFLIGPENAYIARYHPDWVRVDPQEGAAGNGLDFLAMHRVMLSMLRTELPSWATNPAYADLGGFPWGQFPVAPDDATWPVPAGNPRAFDVHAAQALANFEQRLGSFTSENVAINTDDLFGRYLETRHRPIPGTAWNLTPDRTAGFHNYMHGRFNDPTSPVRMGNFARNIEGRVFWRLHGWIDEAWTRFRVATRPGLADSDDPTYLGAMNRACADMMASHMGHAHGSSVWNPITSRCTAH